LRSPVFEQVGGQRPVMPFRWDRSKLRGQADLSSGGVGLMKFARFPSSGYDG